MREFAKGLKLRADEGSREWIKIQMKIYDLQRNESCASKEDLKKITKQIKQLKHDQKKLGKKMHPRKIGLCCW